MTVTVGDYGQESVVTIGGVNITAQPGEPGYIQGLVVHGGDGYSGGGDYGQYDGGVAGGQYDYPYQILKLPNTKFH